VKVATQSGDGSRGGVPVDYPFGLGLAPSLDEQGEDLLSLGPCSFPKKLLKLSGEGLELRFEPKVSLPTLSVGTHPLCSRTGDRHGG